MASLGALVPARDATPASKLLTLVGVVVVTAGLHFGRQVLIPLALAVVFAFLLTPVVGLVEKCRLGRVPSVLAVLVVSFALAAAIGWGVTNQLMQIMARLPDYKANIHDKMEVLRGSASGGLGKATATVNDLSKELSASSEAAEGKKSNRTNGNKEPLSVQVAAPPRNATEYLRDVVGPLADILETTGIVVVFTLIILVKREDLRNRVLRLAGSGQLNVMTQAIDDASRRLSRYLMLQFAVNVGYGILFGLGVEVIRIPHPLLWGVFAGLLRFVPYVGTAAAAVLPMGMAMAVFPGWSQVGLTFALFLFLEITIANVVEPWLYGAHTGISSLAILVAAIFWGMLWGPVGLILSTPLTVCLILLGKYVPQLSFLEILLGDEPVLSPQAHFYQRLLALDDEEARDIAEKYLKENPLGSLYDSVLVPALGLAEQDRHMNALDEVRSKFIHQSTRELIDELYDISLNEGRSSDDDLSAVELAVPSPGSRIVCIPARDEADEIVGIMVMQLLRRAGYDAHVLPIGPVATMLDQVKELRPDIVCVSALPPFAAGQAKSLCKHLRQRSPKVKIVLGLWDYPGGAAKAQERVGLTSADVIGTAMVQIVSLIGGLAASSAPAAEEAPADHKLSRLQS
jgi:predicted PurR-regulated permease PerM